MAEFSTIQTLNNVTPVYGYWLADAGHPLANQFFDLTEPITYPFRLSSHEEAEIKELIRGLKHKVFYVTCFYDLDEEARTTLCQLLAKVRQAALDKCPVSNKRIPTYTGYRHYKNNQLSKEKLQKRLFFLHLAKQIVAGCETTGSVALKYNIDKTNVAIWLSIFLTHGEEAFYAPEPQYSKEDEELIASKHLKNGNSVALTCAQALLFSRKRLHNMLRRYRLSHQ